MAEQYGKLSFKDIERRKKLRVAKIMLEDPYKELSKRERTIGNQILKQLKKDGRTLANYVKLEGKPPPSPPAPKRKPTRPGIAARSAARVDAQRDIDEDIAGRAKPEKAKKAKKVKKPEVGTPAFAYQERVPVRGGGRRGRTVTWDAGKLTKEDLANLVGQEALDQPKSLPKPKPKRVMPRPPGIAARSRARVEAQRDIDEDIAGRARPVPIIKSPVGPSKRRPTGAEREVERKKREAARRRQTMEIFADPSGLEYGRGMLKPEEAVVKSEPKKSVVPSVQPESQSKKEKIVPLPKRKPARVTGIATAFPKKKRFDPDIAAAFPKPKHAEEFVGTGPKGAVAPKHILEDKPPKAKKVKKDVREDYPTRGTRPELQHHEPRYIKLPEWLGGGRIKMEVGDEDDEFVGMNKKGGQIKKSVKKVKAKPRKAKAKTRKRAALRGHRAELRGG